MTDTTMASAQPPGGVVPPAAGEGVNIAWDGPTWGLAGLGFINLLLTIVTLGIYNFWAKTEVRKRVSHSIRINGEPMEYAGTGWELFSGFLLILFAILLPFIVLVVGVQILIDPVAGAILQIAVLPVIWYLYNVAIYRARRYRRSRMRWRGVRAAMTGSSWAYGWHSLWTSIVANMTWGWLTPWRDNMLHRRMISETRFGETGFTYKGKAEPLYGSYALAWFGSIGLFLLIGGIAAAVIYPIGQPLFEAIGNATIDGKTDWDAPELKDIGWLMFPLIALGYGFLALYGVLASTLWCMFWAKEYSYFSANTFLGGLSFKLDVKGWPLFWLFFSNTVMSLLTLTILSPVAEARVARYFVNRLQTGGTIDFAAIEQSSAKVSKTGEGLAEALDVEAGSYFILSI